MWIIWSIFLENKLSDICATHLHNNFITISLTYFILPTNQVARNIINESSDPFVY